MDNRGETSLPSGGQRGAVRQMNGVTVEVDGAEIGQRGDVAVAGEGKCSRNFFLAFIKIPPVV